MHSLFKGTEKGRVRELWWLSMVAVQKGRQGQRIQGQMEVLKTQSCLPASLPSGLPARTGQDLPETCSQALTPFLWGQAARSGLGRSPGQCGRIFFKRIGDQGALGGISSAQKQSCFLTPASLSIRSHQAHDTDGETEAQRWLSTSQGEKPQKKLTLPTP